MIQHSHMKDNLWILMFFRMPGVWFYIYLIIQ